MSSAGDSELEIRGKRESRISSLSSLLIVFAVLLLFFAARLVLLLVRQPFFDELFTVWMARQPLASVIPNLLNDSGPPLYYWLARLDSVRELRWLSLFFATLQIAVIAWQGRTITGDRQSSNDGRHASNLSRSSLLAAALLALYPPAALSAVDARAYALCGLLVTLGVVAMAAARPFAGATAFVAGAYSHYYGVLFFPLLLTGVGAEVAEQPEEGGPRFAPAATRRVIPFVTACVAFIPGFILAMKQPQEATSWNREPLSAPMLNISWAGSYPDSLFAPAPMLIAIVAVLLLVAAVSRSWRFAPSVLVPLLLVVAFHLAGRPVYFPMRFESVIAGPLALWAASSLTSWRPRSIANSLAAALLVAGALSIYFGATIHLRRRVDPYRAAATALRDHVRPADVVVATGFCYLESTVALQRPVIAWPEEQARHPGWRARTRGDVRALPAGTFIWIGERQSAELAELREARPLQPLFLNERAVIARVGTLTPPLH